MSETTSAPIVTLGAVILMKPTATAVQLGAVIVQNMSPYQLSVDCGGNVTTLPPYMADIYSTLRTGAAVRITPTNADGVSGVVTGARINAIWLEPDEVPDAGSYPATLGNPSAAEAVAIGAQVAAQTAAALLAGGVPNVIKMTAVANADHILAGGQKTYDISAYASLILRMDAFGANPVIRYEQLDPFGNLVDYDAFISPGSLNSSALRIAAVGSSMVVFNTSASPIDVTITGSNRPALKRFEQASDSGSLTQFIFPFANIAAGSTNTIPQTTSNQPCFDGECTVSIELHRSAATLTGWFQMRCLTGDATTTVVPITICDTTEMITNPRGAVVNSVYIMKSLVIPAGFQSFEFVNQAGGATNASIYINVMRA